MKTIATILACSVVILSFADDQETIDSLKEVIETTSSDTVKINALNEWDNLIYISDPALDNELNAQVAEICEDNLRKGDELTEEEVYFYKDKLASAYNILGINADDAGDYPLALDFYYKSRWIAEDIGQMEIVGGLYNNIGLIHEKTDNIDLALEFYRKSLELVDQLEDYNGVVNALSNIGSVYLANKEYERSLEYYWKALDVAEVNGFDYLASITLGNIGVAYERLDMLDSALFYYHIGKEDMLALDDWDGLSNLNYNIGMVYVQREEWSKAISSCREGYNVAKKHEGRYRMTLNCDCLFKAFNGAGNTDSALYYYILQDTLAEAFDSKETTREIATKEIQYQAEKERFEDSLQFANEMTLRDVESEKKEAEFRLQLAYLLGGLGLLVLLGIVIYSRLIVAKKQRNEIQAQAELTKKQKEIIQEQKHEIDQSIDYAKLIQEATLPTKDHTAIFNDSFLLYLPKDVVSGDFYWIEENEYFQFFTVADCTGHGIPGAFISLIGTILLNEIYNSKKIHEPNLMLDELNRLVQLTLTTSKREMKDGMDISFCVLNKSTKELLWAGANNPVWIISESKTLTVNGNEAEANLTAEQHLFEVKADKRPVGKYHDQAAPFTLNRIQLNPGDKIYLFSDGFPDQFGGERWKKYKYKPFKEFLLKINTESLSSQHDLIEAEFNGWKGDNEQIDDVCILGVKV